MNVTALIENKSIHEELKAQHGLSLYIETKNHHILFDMGQDASFISNAKKLGIDLTKVDIAIVSHGHYDHGGGLHDFLNINQHAIIYLSKHAFEEHIKIINEQEQWIGVKKPLDTHQVKFINEDTVIDDELTLISEITYQPSIILDTLLFYKDHHTIKKEVFNHELYLVINEEQRYTLFTGCSHKGIEHIVKEVEVKVMHSLQSVIGGFHFSHYHVSNEQETNYLIQLGEKFNRSNTSNFYACHCTGDDAFGVLKKHMKKKLHSLHTGEKIII